MSMSLPTFDKNKGTCNDREKKEWKNANLLFIKKRRFDSCSRRGTLNLSHWCMAGKSYSAVAVVVPWTWAIDAWREKVIPGHRVRCFRSHCWKSLLTRCCCVLSTLAASCLPRSYSSFQTDGSFLSLFKAFITILASFAASMRSAFSPWSIFDKETVLENTCSVAKRVMMKSNCLMEHKHPLAFPSPSFERGLVTVLPQGKMSEKCRKNQPHLPIMVCTKVLALHVFMSSLTKTSWRKNSWKASIRLAE